ncbi:MAG: TonB family protein [Flavobacteriales bacterium]|nr:TonB family protein [Flavobacteriales bacterium]
MQGINPKYNRTGKITGATVVILLLFLSFMFDIDPPMLVQDEEEEEEEIVAILDYTNAGGGSSGGSEKPAETPEEDAAPDNHETVTDPQPVQNTQVEESPVYTPPTQASSESDGGGSSQTPANDWGNPFGGNGGGQDGGEGGGSGDDGVGPGDGPGIGGGVGSGDGRLVLEEPHITNPVQDEGRVMLELIIDRDGNVISVKVLKSHSLTTTTNPAHFEAAKNAAWKWKFNKDPQGAEKQKLFKSINFTLD